MSDFDVWVDFNSVDINGRVVTLMRYAPEDIQDGQAVIVGDHEGNTCPAVVVNYSNMLIELQVDLSMFVPAP